MFSFSLRGLKSCMFLPEVGLDLTTTAAKQLPQSLTGTQLKPAFETPVGREHTNPPEVRQSEQN